MWTGIDELGIQNLDKNKQRKKGVIGLIYPDHSHQEGNQGRKSSRKLKAGTQSKASKTKRHCPLLTSFFVSLVGFCLLFFYLSYKTQGQLLVVTPLIVGLSFQLHSLIDKMSHRLAYMTNWWHSPSINVSSSMWQISKTNKHKEALYFTTFTSPPLMGPLQKGKADDVKYLG